MCFCLPLTVVSLPQRTEDYWAAQCERKEEEDEEMEGGVA